MTSAARRPVWWQIWRGGSAYALALGTTALVEGWLGKGTPFALFAGFGLSLVPGLLGGGALGASVAWLERGGRLRQGALLLACVAAGLWLSSYLGILRALSGGAPRLAAGSLALTLGAAGGFGALLLGLARGPRPSRDTLGVDPRLLAAFLTLMGAGAAWGAHSLVPPAYSSVQEVGVAGGALLFGLVLQGALADVASGCRIALSTSAALLSLIAAAAVLTERAGDTQRAAFENMGLARLALKLSNFLTDVDGDGYSSLLGGGDCAPWDARVHPGAPEIPNNGIDDNCVWGDAPARQLAPELDLSAAPPSPLSVVLITLDTIRWDSTGLSGRAPSLTPSLDTWARNAAIYERAYTASTRTCSSVGALHYGSFPRALHWAVEGSAAIQRLRQRLPQAQPRLVWICFPDEAGFASRRPLAQLLQARHMATAAVVNDYGTLLLQREFFGAGFDVYRDEPDEDDQRTVRVAIDTLSELEQGDRPFFLWVHLFGAHDRPGTHALHDTQLDYDAAVRRTDATVAPLLNAIEQVSARAPLATFVLSDHGEVIEKQERWHARNLSDELLRIPLLVRAPGVAPGRSNRFSSSVDVAPTILGLTRTAVPTWMAGLDLLNATGGHAVLFSDTWVSALGFSLTAAYDGESKTVYSHSLRSFEDFSLAGGRERSSSNHPLLRQALERYLGENELNL